MSSDLLEELRTTTRQALAADSSDDVVDQLDLAGLLVDGEFGGLGMGDREMVLVGEEIGRSKASSSFLATVVLASTLLSFGESDAAELLKELPLSRYVVALSGAVGSWLSGPPSVVATRSAQDGWLLSGRAWGLTNPGVSQRVLAAASTADGVALFVAHVDRAAVTVADEFDPGRGLVEVGFDGTPARLIGGAAADALRAAYRRALLTVGAEQLGVARTCLETSVEYAKTRTQFGAPIGSFQSIKHRCADVLLDAELADAVLQQAVESAELADSELAFIVATRAAVFAAESCIHIHGGIGFTWEHPAHWYLRRARVNATLLGPPGLHRSAIAESAGLAAIQEGHR
jgi:alkylation response protein AidB-like acyl-CoA dehydrogenase